MAIKVRLSNIELLRIIAMFMVISVHADYWILGVPTIDDFRVSSFSTFTRIYIEQLTIVGVNVFVLISGWFGIRPSKKSVLSLLFQIFFFLFGIYAIGIITGLSHFSIKSFAQCFLFTHSYWFIKAYMGLYILSPIINRFIETSSKQVYFRTLCSLFLFQFIYGWINSEIWINQGYSTFSFIALYLLAKYIRLYGAKWTTSIWGGLCMYLITSFLATIIGFIGVMLCIPLVPNLMISYINPLVVMGSLGLLIAFANISLKHSVTINKIAQSTFAVYLFPCFWISDYIYRQLFIDIYNKYNGITVILLITAILVGLYTVSVIVDQIRIILWRRIWKAIENYNNCNNG